MLEHIRFLAKKLVQTARLMVGVHDYESYLRRQSQRPNMPVLNRKEFFLACQDARYSQKGRISRCPC